MATKKRIQVGDFVRLVSAEDFLRGEEGQVKESKGERRWMIRLENGATVYRHETEFLVVASAFPSEVAAVIDRAWQEIPSAHELDAEGRFVRGTYQGMTPAEVLAERDAFNRCM